MRADSDPKQSLSQGLYPGLGKGPGNEVGSNKNVVSLPAEQYKDISIY